MYSLLYVNYIPIKLLRIVVIPICKRVYYTYVVCMHAHMYKSVVFVNKYTL